MARLSRVVFCTLAGAFELTWELLRHESGKTTEIYTPITHRGWEKLKSPIDDFELINDIKFNLGSYKKTLIFAPPKCVAKWQWKQ